MNNIKEFDEYIKEEFGGKTIFSILLSLLLSYGSLKSQPKEKEIEKYGVLFLKDTAANQYADLYRRALNVNDYDEVLEINDSIKHLVEKHNITDPLILRTLESIENEDIEEMTLCQIDWSNKFDPARQQYVIDMLKNNWKVILGVICFAFLLNVIKSYKNRKN